MLDRGHIKHKGTRNYRLGLPGLLKIHLKIILSNSTLAVVGSELTRSFHILNPRYENVRSPLLVVFRLGWISLYYLVSYVVLLHLNRSRRHSAFKWWNDLYVPMIDNLSLYKSKEEYPFLWSSSSYINSNVSWSMRCDRSWIFSNFWLFLFPQKCHTKGQYS